MECSRLPRSELEHDSSGQLCCADHQDARGAAGSGSRANFDDYVVIRGRWRSASGFYGEAFELVALQGGDLRLVDAEDAGCFGLGEIAFGEDRIERGGEADFGSQLFGVRQAEVGEDVSAAGGDDTIFLALP
ncbi:MAG TPA: hypothetical protein VGU23_06055 [Acidobacteriaceae bacterium]|nr:hypothetical protein [Acidobacteriaceae bacterium]